MVSPIYPSVFCALRSVLRSIITTSWCTLIAAICRRCRQHLSELVSQTKSDSSAHAQLPIQPEQGEQEIVTEDLEQHAQGQVRASTIMSQMRTSPKIICIPGERTQSRGVSFKGFHLKMTLCSRHAKVKLNTFF